MKQTRILLLFLASLASLAALSPAGTQPADPSPSSYDLTFETAWRLIRDTHFDPTYNGVDWDAVHEEFAPLAEHAGSQDEIRAIISDMLTRLGESHFALIPSEVADVLPGEDAAADVAPDEAPHPDAVVHEESPAKGAQAPDPEEEVLENESYGGGDAWLGLDVRPLDGRLLITRVEPGSPADQAGIRPGWVITYIGKRDVARRIDSFAHLDLKSASTEIVAWQILTELLSGELGSLARLSVLDADGNSRRLTLKRVPRPGEMAKFGNLPPLNSRLEWSWLDPEKYDIPSDVRVGYIRFNIFMMPASREFERAVYELRDADGLVIDIRGNLGGIGALAMGMGGRLVDKTASLGTMQMRGASLKFNLYPQYATSWGQPTHPFTGRLAIITDAISASTSEVFAGGLQAIGRAEVFGERTAGMALPAAMDRLPNGDVLLHAIADFHTSKGERLEKTGVIPDVPVPTTREDLLAGIDAPLARAAHWAATGEE
ncbi:MAG: S41 family peptidase [Phycisphaerales bacterium]